MKKLLALFIAILGSVVLVMASNPTILFVAADGYVVPEEYNIVTSLSKGDETIMPLHSLSADDTIYSSFFKSYDYADKTTLNLDYPMYTNNGISLYFMTNDYWMISNDFEILETYDGLYLSDGSTYNSDLSIADAETFLLVSLANGLYMNAREASFTNSVGTTKIPANSILKFENTGLRFYAYNGGELLYTGVEGVFASTITIGDNTYDYMDFLKALGLFDDAIKNLEDGKDIDDIQDELDELLNNGNKIESDDFSNITSADREQLEVGPNETLPNEYGKPSIGDGLTGAFGDMDLEQTDSNTPTGSSTPSTSGGGAGSTDTPGGSTESESTGSGSGSSSGELAEGEPDPNAPPSDVGSNNNDDSSDQDLEENPSSPGDGATGDGESIEPEYQEPVITFSNIDTWAYSLFGNIDIDDPSLTLKKGVSAVVYKNIVGVGGPSGELEGYESYSADKYVGKTAQLRKTYYATQDITLSGLSPDTDLYIQFSYKYSLEKELEDGEKYYVTTSVLSDLYKIPTKSIEDSNLTDIVLTYDDSFAAYPDRFMLDDFYVKNGSDYDETLETFDNFKKNILPYISKITFDFEDEADRDTMVLSSNVKAAQKDGGIIYTSNATSLTSNDSHNYTICAEDKYGNELPLIVNGEGYEGYKGTFYTAKKKPTVEIVEVSNVTDELTLEIIVTDEDGALEKDVNGNVKPLQLLVTDSDDNLTYLSGVWDSGTKFNSVDNMLLLEEPTHNKSYKFTLESLAFAKSYTISTYGDYAPQPDNITHELVDNQPNLLLGADTVYTAPITAGNIILNMSTLETLDTSASIGLTISDDSTFEILPLMDEARVSVKNQDTGAGLLDFVLEEAELSEWYVGDGTHTYDAQTGTVLLYDGTGYTIKLYGLESEFDNQKSLWDCMMPYSYQDPITNETKTKSGAQLRIAFEDKTLLSSSYYEIDYEGIVIKSGVEYDIPVVMSNDRFRTKKLDPVVVQKDTFIANDIIRFIELDVIDTDGAIIGDGEIQVQLYMGDAMLDLKSININDDPQDVEFSQLSVGLQYRVEVRAVQYNNDIGSSGYKTNFLLASYDIEAGSDIKADISIKSLDYVYKYQQSENTQTAEVPGSDFETALNDLDTYKSNGWAMYGSTTDYDACYMGYYSLKDDLGIDTSKMDLLELLYNPDKKDATNPEIYGGKIVYFYDADKKSLGGHYVGNTESTTLMCVIPDNAVYIRVLLGDVEYVKQWGVSFVAYDTGEDALEPLIYVYANSDVPTGDPEITALYKKNLQTSSAAKGELETTSDRRVIDMMPVVAGDQYLAALNNSSYYIYYYNERQEYIGYTSSFVRGRPITIPDGVHYISFTVYNTYNFSLYKIGQPEVILGSGEKYELHAEMTLYDKKGYLIDEKGNSTVNIVLEKSDLSNADRYVEVATDPGAFDDIYPDSDVYAAIEAYQEYLEPNSKYRISVKAVYNNSEITLASEEFNTDGSYLIIDSSDDLMLLRKFPYSNFLVTEDIELNYYNDQPFNGTIDFNGHVLTTKTNTTFLNTLGDTGVVKNLVYRVESGYITSLIHNNYGLMENIIVETVGVTEDLTTDRAFLVTSNYGTVQNFIIKLGGDVIFTTGYNALAVRYVGEGIVQNGYIYSESTGAVVTKTAGLVSGGVCGYIRPPATVQNIYTSFNTYVADDPAGEKVSYGYTYAYSMNSSDVQNVYHFGEYYLFENGKKTTTLFDTRQFSRLNSSKYIKNAWHITSNEYLYPDNTQDYVNTTSASMLVDIDWQKSVLTDGFEIEKTVSMGYFPRLDLPVCMQIHQPYRLIPKTSPEEKPEIIMDKFLDGAAKNNTSGTMVLYLENPKAYEIKGVTIPGLDTTVLSQEATQDNLYEVIVKISVTEDEALEAYLSAYEITELKFAYSGSVITIDPEYTTGNIAFYKEVGTQQQWYNINLHMDWNYRITNDITFNSQSSVAGMRINGSTELINSYKHFEGSIDGGIYDENGTLTGMHKVSGMSVVNVDDPYIIYRLATGASVTNLIVDNLNIATLSTNNVDFCGFIGYAYRETICDNVHLINSNIASGTYTGGLVGYMNGTISNCSVQDTVMKVTNTTEKLYFGGIVGMLYYADMDNCYTRNVSITAQNINSVEGVGGLIGVQLYSGLQDSYANGTILTDCSNVGGIVGKAYHEYAAIERVYSYVDIESTAEVIGGIVGHSDARMLHTLAVGNIFAGTNSVHRVAGVEITDRGFRYPNYAYSEQLMNELSSSEYDDAEDMFTSQELKQDKTWIDSMLFGNQWDYTALDDDMFPKLYYKNTTTLLYGQETGIPIPGNDDITLELTSAQILADDKGYWADILVSDVNRTYEELKAGIEDKSITFTIEGMDMSDSSFNDGKWSYTIEQQTGSESLRLKITTTIMEKAMDVYKFLWKSDGGETTLIINYGEPLYNVISNITEWNAFMENGHDRSVENIKIDGEIDFGGKTPTKMNLLIGRLEGITDTACFTNMNFVTANVEGGSGNFITSVKGVSNIDFKNISVTVLDTYNKKVQEQSTLINLCIGDFKDLTIENFTVNTSNAYGGGMGLCYDIQGLVENVDVNKVTLTSTTSGTSQRSYTGAIAGKLTGSFVNVVADTITIDAPYGNYVGGLFGSVTSFDGTEYKIPCSDNHVTNVTINAYRYVGGMFGTSSYMQQLQDVSVQSADLQAKYDVGGIAYHFFARSNGNKNTDIKVSDSSVISTLATTSSDIRTGGVFGNMYYYGEYEGITVENVTVEGFSRVGGVTGRFDGPNVTGVQVIGCTIKQHNESNTDTANYGAGAFAGMWVRNANTIKNIVVRDTTVVADNNAGGVVGNAHINYRVSLDNVYVAEDVTVIATNDCAGGIIGRVEDCNFNDIAVGAEVIAMGEKAGGVIGNFAGVETDTIMKGIYVRGSVTTENYAGGLIGYADSTTVLTDENLVGIILANDVTSSKDYSPVAMFASNVSYQSAKIGLWENALYNGETAIDVFGAIDSETSTLPDHVAYLTADDFKEEDTYTEYALYNFDRSQFTDGVMADAYTYMPFITNGTTTVVGDVLDNTQSYQGSNTGILRPAPGVNTDATVVYVSGINTINVESTQPTVTISTSATAEADDTHTFTEDEQYGDTFNMVTIGYNFKDSIWIDGKEYTPSDLCVTTMTYDIQWYYIKDSKLWYGGMLTTTPEENTQITQICNSNNTSPIHLWQGKLLTDDGKVYRYSDAVWTDVTPETPPVHGEIQAQVQSVFSYSDLTVYYNFSLYTDGKNITYMPYRFMKLGTVAYPIFPSQGATYDGFIMYSADAKSTQFATYSETANKFTSYLAPIDLKDLRANGIVQLSNSFLTTVPIIVAQYDDGSIVVYNFSTGTILCEVTTVPATNSFMAFASNSMEMLRNNAFGSNVIEDDSLKYTNELLGSYEGINTMNLYDPNGSYFGNGENPEEVEDIIAGSIQDSTDMVESTKGELLDGEDSEDIEEGTIVDGPGNSDESNTLDEEFVGSTESIKEITGTIVDGDNIGVETGSIINGTSTVAGAGAIETVEEAKENQVTADTEETKKADDITEQASSEKQLAEYSVGYNPYTGSYETCRTDEMQSSSTAGVAEGQNELLEAKIREAEVTQVADASPSGDEFIISKFTSNKMSTDERNGFIILMAISMLGIVTLVILYFKFRKEK